jgi:mannose/fructose/N-acetylgalactosamine-specific phosphotransferase system component IID
MEKNVTGPRITRWDFFKIFIASFFMQAVWNFRSLISVGFSVCFFPVLGKLCENREAKREFFHRHLRFFNAHPYFASFALGVSLRLEQMRSSGELQIPDMLDRLKEVLIGPLGAVGDRLFWATIKPASLIFGMFWLLLAPNTPLKVAALVATFLVYNVPHFYFRYKGLREGYDHPMDIHKYVNQKRFENLRKTYLAMFVVSLIALAIVFGYRVFQMHPALIAVFVCSSVYAFLFNKVIKNFYLVCLATFTFFLTVGILFF